MLSGIEVGLTAWAGAALAAGLAGVDATSWPQAMLSRPLVAATAGGWLLGDPASGAAAGVVLELLAARHLPLGGARCPDTGPASVVAGAAAAGAGGPAAGSVAAAALVGWVVGWLGEASVRLLRGLSARVLEDAARLSREPRRLERRHRLMVVLDAARGATLGAALLVPAVAVVRVAAGGAPGVPAAALLGLTVGGAGGAAGRSFSGERRGAVLVAAGGAAGLLAALVAA